MVQCIHPQKYDSPCPARSPSAMASGPTFCAGGGVGPGSHRPGSGAGPEGEREGVQRRAQGRGPARASGSRRPRGGATSGPARGEGEEDAEEEEGEPLRAAAPPGDAGQSQGGLQARAVARQDAAPRDRRRGKGAGGRCPDPARLSGPWLKVNPAPQITAWLVPTSAARRP